MCSDTFGLNDIGTKYKVIMFKEFKKNNLIVKYYIISL